jgi:hypothetical protein
MSAIQKYSEVVKDFEFCDDFGDSPLLMGHFTTDRSLIAVISLLGGFVAMAGLGIPGALLVAFAALNDVSYAGKVDRDEDEDSPAPEGNAVDGAIDVPVVTVEGNAAAIAAAPSMVHSKVLCPIEVLGRDPYQSMGLIGGQRTGKTWLAALHTQNVKRKRGTKIIYINLMDAIGDAADDWSHADICITCHLRKLPPNKAKAMIEHVTSVVNDFFNDLNQILIFDEWVGFTSKANQWPKKASQEASAAAIESKEAKTYIEPEGLGTSAIELMNLVMAVVGELTQSGKKQLKAIWLLSPMVKAGSVELQGLIIKEVQPMVVAISKDESVSWTHPVTGETQEIGFDDAGYRASIPNMGLPPIESIPKMDCVRMLYAKGTWYSLDNLPELEQMPKSETRSPSPTMGNPIVTSAPTRSRRGRITIPTRQATTDARQKLEQAWEVDDGESTDLDPAIELINEEPNPAKREALMIAYQWARAREDKGDSVDRQTFLERARKDRNCEYLKEHRDEIWEELQGLLN